MMRAYKSYNTFIGSIRLKKTTHGDNESLELYENG